jgi:truncated hemoglobin YjbI
MSKQELQQRAFQASGVSYEDSLKATTKLHPTLYERIGQEEGFERLSQIFYDRVFADKDATWFLNIFSSSTKQEAVDNQFRFFVQTFGGPDLYRQKKGQHTRLVGRHANYNITDRAADRWVQHMKDAMEEHDNLKGDIEAKEALFLYFQYTAHYIVAASDYMRPDQVRRNIRVGNVIILYILILFSSLSTAERRDKSRFRSYLVIYLFIASSTVSAMFENLTTRVLHNTAKVPMKTTVQAIHLLEFNKSQA